MKIGLHYKYYYRARYYDPALGRFLSEDPISFNGGSMNLYQYASSDPTLHNDPSGKFVPGFILGVFIAKVFVEMLDGISPDEDMQGIDWKNPKDQDIIKAQAIEKRWKIDEDLRKEQEKFKKLELIETDKEELIKLRPRKDDPGQCFKV